MSTGTACWIFRDLSKTTYTDEEKLEAIYIVANMATHNAIKKSEMVSAIKWLLRKVRGWIPVEEQLPEEKVNPVSQDFYEYQVTAKFGKVKDVRHYKYGNGHWWHGPGIVDNYVIAWRENPEPYRPERSDNHDRE